MHIFPVLGLPEFTPSNSIAQEIITATEQQPLQDGDVLVVTSKIVSKAENQFRPVSEKSESFEAETVRVVARFPGGRGSGIVENRLGLVMAAAGIDESNIEGDRLLLLPEDPDASAKQISEEIERLSGAVVGVVISDTCGRPWRLGQTDIAIGGYRVQLMEDVRGTQDTSGKPLSVTIRCIGDEMAAAADLVKKKASGIPVAVIRGLSEHVGDEFTHTARSIVRPPSDDLFTMGTAEAIAEGKRLATLAER